MPVSGAAYFAFLTAIVFLYWPLARFRAASLAVILLANYFFCARWGLLYLLLIPAASTLDFLVGLGLERAGRRSIRRALVGVSLAVNLGILISLRGSSLTLAFYAFQALTYTLDIYRRDAGAAGSLLAHLAAAGFFPTLLSGPITRVADLLPQLERRPKTLSPEDGGRALWLIGLGLVKKLLIADYLGANLVDRVFDLPKLYTAAETLAALYAYAFQLYYDFSGYTDIVTGSALLLGLRLPRNFDRPYASSSVVEFWRRWHITLSNWLRDYLYFSLPGLRSRWKLITYLNLLLTMALGGLWHGLSWNFLIWGLLHGAALAATRAAAGRFPRSALATFHFVCFAWIFFRAPSLGAAWSILERLGSLSVSFANISPLLALVLALAAAAHFLPSRWHEAALRLYTRAPFYAQAAALVVLAWGLTRLAGAGSAPFIYTRF